MILITGVTGYIGRHLVQSLVAGGERPRCLVRDLTKARKLWPGDEVELAQGDTTAPASLSAAGAGCETVIHAAFLTADRKPGPGVSYAATNVTGTANLIQAAQAGGVRR